MPAALLSPRGLSVQLRSVLHSATRGTVSVALLGLLTACGSISDLLTPGVRDETTAPAQVALNASVAASVGSAGDVVTLGVNAQYVRRDGSRVALGSQTVALAGAARQAVPLSVDLARCLGDDGRDATSAKDRSCSVVLELTLMVNGIVVDRQVIGPLRLAPGVTVGVDEPVALYDIASLEVLASGIGAIDVGDTVRVVEGEGVELQAIVRDRQGKLVTDRAVVWVSDAPAIATISSPDGAVSTLARGDVRFTATLGTLSRTVAMRVIRAPAALQIVAASGSGRGTIRSSPPGIDCRIDGASQSGACAFTFPGEATVTLASAADAGSAPLAWGEACAGEQAAAVCVLSMERPRLVAVGYTALRRVAVAADGGDGAGRVTGPMGLDCRLEAGRATGTCEVEVRDGASVTLVAAPDVAPDAGTPATVLVGWGGDCASFSATSCVLDVTRARTATVRFEGGRLLGVMMEGSGSGEVVDADGVDCRLSGGTASGVCARLAAFGSRATLTARVGPATVFAGWSGECDVVHGSQCEVSLTRAKTVVARFVGQRTVSVVAGPEGGRGRVTGTGGIDCQLDADVASGRCQVAVADSAPVILRASIDSAGGGRQTFVGWDGACAAATGTTCSLPAGRASETVVARFAGEQRLDVVLDGVGGGQVVATYGVSCVRANGRTTGACDATAPYGATVVLTAIPDSYSAFAGWSGACAAVPGPICTTTLNEARSVVAVFKRLQATLTIVASGPVPGTVAVNGSTFCTLAAGQGSATCSGSFAVGTTVQLSGSAASGSVFGGFSGDCNGVAPCALTVTRDMRVGATFSLPPVTVTVAVFGRGAGTVSSGGAIACSRSNGSTTGTCTETVPYGTTITLTSAAATSSRLEVWTGACAGTSGASSICTLRVTGDVTIGAGFTKAP